MGHYIWEKADWPKLHWDSQRLMGALGQARKEQGKLMAQASFIGLEDKANFLIEEVVKTSAIEGEKLDKESVRSSVARRLGLSVKGLPAEQRHIEGLVEMLMDANKNYSDELSEKRMFGWHGALFPTGYSGMTKIHVGGWRKTKEPMQVVSGPIGKKVVHFEAPPTQRVNDEIKSFMQWWVSSSNTMDGLIRAAVAHLWFLTIHPFEDGNGRIARAITDMALAQDEKSDMRLYSLSSQIENEKESYYNILEKTQKGDLDITDWLEWFLRLFVSSMNNSYTVISKALFMAKFWQSTNRAELNDRQMKVLKKMLEAEPQGFDGGMTNKKYVNITKTSRETAKRDLFDLEEQGLLAKNNGRGRSVSYSLVHSMKEMED